MAPSHHRQMAVSSKWPTICAASAFIFLLVALGAPVNSPLHEVRTATVALSERHRSRATMADASVKRIHSDARLLLAHTIMAKGARRDLSKIAGGKHSRLSSILDAAAHSFAQHQRAQVVKSAQVITDRLKLHQRREQALETQRAKRLLKRSIDSNGFISAPQSHRAEWRGAGGGGRERGQGGAGKKGDASRPASWERRQRRAREALDLGKRLRGAWNAQRLLSRSLSDHRVRIANAGQVADTGWPYETNPKSLQKAAERTPRRRADQV